ncbi:MAG: hypothetical protein GF364_01460 [Candidatus Lokiarchaeota archaeon]|nr:hypothetical protein [Candidatus Lokiarchaeota archaeon]
MSDDETYLGDDLVFIPHYKYGFMDKITMKIDVLGLNGKIGPTIYKKADFRGPEYILRIDKKMVSRVNPPQGTPDFKPNYFPYIEFSDIDFPWRYSQSGDNYFDANKGAPWICLIAISSTEIEQMEAQNIDVFSKLDGTDILTVRTKYLPDLKQIWGSAHIQLTNYRGELNADAVSSWVDYNPANSFSRILCLRKLNPNKKYFVFLVPTFHESMEPYNIQNTDKPKSFIPSAWRTEDNKIVSLPIYYQWSFLTSEEGDFEYLVRKIKPGNVSSDIGTEYVDASFRLNNDSEKKLHKHIFKREGALVASKYLDNEREPYHKAFEKIGREDNPKQEELLRSLNISIMTNKSSAIVQPEDKPVAVYVDKDKKKKKKEKSGKKTNKKNKKYSKAKMKKADKPLKPEYKPKFSKPSGNQLSIDKDIKELTFTNIAKISKKPYKVLAQKYYIADDILDRIKKKKNKVIPYVPVTLPIPIIEFTELDPLVTYPVYGRYFKHVDEIKKPTISRDKAIWNTKDPWIHELNLDWRYRLAASLGTWVIQNNQEEFMEECWMQVGRIRAANERLRRAKIAFDFNKRIFQNHFLNLSREHLTFLTTPFHVLPTLNVQNTELSVKDMYNTTGITSGVISPALIKIAGNHIKSNQIFDATQIFTPYFKIDTVNAELSDDLKPSGNKDKDLDLNEFMGEAFGIKEDLPEWNLKKQKPKEEEIPLYQKQTIEAPIAGMFGEETGEDNKDQVPTVNYIMDSANVMFFPNAIKNTLEITLSNIIQFNDDRDIFDDFDPIMECPIIETPMYGKLKEINQDYLMPGIGEVENNSIFVLRENRKFIESFMVGLNHEMGRELLWREFPTDQRGTIFKYFWDYSNAMVDENGDIVPPPDIADIHKFKHILGENKVILSPMQQTMHIFQQALETGGSFNFTFSGQIRDSEVEKNKNSNKDVDGDEPELVLVIKADLVKRYPDLNIFGVFAKKELEIKDVDDVGELTMDNKKISQIILPSFRGQLADDTIIVGFPFDEDEIFDNDEDIYYIVLQENQELPTFGLDAGGLGDDAAEAEADSGAGDLSWDQIDDKYIGNGYINNVEEAFKINDDSDVNSSLIAKLTYQKPVRVLYNIKNVLK